MARLDSWDLRALGVAAHVLAAIAIAEAGRVVLRPQRVVRLELVACPGVVAAQVRELAGDHGSEGGWVVLPPGSWRTEEVVVDHVPQLVVERVALAPRRSVTHVNVQRAARQVRHVAPPLPVVVEVLAQQQPLEADALQEGAGVESVLPREELERLAQRGSAWRHPADAGARARVGGVRGCAVKALLGRDERHRPQPRVHVDVRR